MSIEIQTKFDYVTFRDCIRFQLFKTKLSKVFTTVLLIMSSLVLSVSLLAWIFLSDVSYLTYSVFGAICLIMLLLFYFVGPTMVYRMSKPMMADETIYRFYDNHFEFFSVGDNVQSSNLFQYETIQKVYEVNRAYYLFAPYYLVFVLPKHCLSSEQILQLSDFFSSHLGKKYEKRVK